MARKVRQDPENQLRDLRAWCANSSHDLAGEYVDRVSGRKGTGARKRFAALFEDARRRKFDCVLFWALDRFSREGHGADDPSPRAAELLRRDLPQLHRAAPLCP